MKSNLEKLKYAFSVALGIEEEQVTDNLTYQSIPQWDSIAHMVLISQIEGEFDISFETEEVLGLSSFKNGIQILINKGIKF